MIRRGFWLTAGAVAGIMGYRRVSAVGRRLSASLNPGTGTGTGTGNGTGNGTGSLTGTRAAARAALVSGSTLARGGRLTGRGAVAVAAETFKFARDVREGMELYTARHSAPARSTTLGARDHEPPQLERLTTDHDLRPKDGR
ncbi:MAG: hypothetical protein ACRDOB_14165 [Streptosporangiaceae bacterium]